jgi:hypothetical protein
MAEAHHAAGLSYGKLHRTVMNELALRRDQRTNGMIFLQHVRTETDRLESTAPSILPHIIRLFNKQFAHRTIEKPEITGDLDEVEVNTGMGPLSSDNSSPNVAPFDSTALVPVSTKPIVVAPPSSVISTLGSLLTSTTQFFTPPPAPSSVSLDMSNMVVDMGVKTDKDDMGYSMLVQESPSPSTTSSELIVQSKPEDSPSSNTNS